MKTKTTNCFLFSFYFLLPICVMCFLYFIYFFLFWLSLFRKQRSLLMKPCNKLFSQVQHKFWCVPLISFKTLFPQVIQFIALLTHYSQLYSYHLLEFQFSFGLEFVLLRLKLLIYAQICLEWEFNLKLIHMHLNIVQATLVRHGLKLQIWKY